MPGILFDYQFANQLSGGLFGSGYAATSNGIQNGLTQSNQQAYQAFQNIQLDPFAEMNEEKRLREKHPGLQELYDQYQVMLALCRESPNNET